MKLINKTIISKNRYDVLLNDNFSEYIKEDFYYIVEDIDISSIPEDVLQIPFILNIAPVIWVSGLIFEIDYMDSNLYNSLQVLKKVFQKLYPEQKFDGELCVSTLSDMKYRVNESKSTQLFSCGVDSVFTLLKHIDENLSLVTLRGSDTDLNDDVGWANVKSLARQYTFSKNNLANYFIASNFKKFLNYKKINSKFKRDWWEFIQHGIGSSCFMALPAFIEGSSIGYIAGGFKGSKANKNISWGSIPEVDESVKWLSFHIIHDGIDFNRQDKIEYITQSMQKVYKKILPLRVCFSIREAKNCTKCAKCFMTMTELLASGNDYKVYGFDIEHSQFIKNIKFALYKSKYKITNPLSLELRLETQEKIRDRLFYKQVGFSDQLIDFLMWMKTFDFYNYYKKQQKIAKRKRFFRNLRKRVKNIFT